MDSYKDTYYTRCQCATLGPSTGRSRGIPPLSRGIPLCRHLYTSFGTLLKSDVRHIGLSVRDTLIREVRQLFMRVQISVELNRTSSRSLETFFRLFFLAASAVFTNLGSVRIWQISSG